MFKTILLLLLAFTMMLETPSARAAAVTHATTTATDLLAPAVAEADFFRRAPRKGRPNYTTYKGANRKKMKKLGPVRKWKLRRKAQTKRRTHVPSVKAGAPIRVMKK